MFARNWQVFFALANLLDIAAKYVKYQIGKITEKFVQLKKNKK